MSPKEKAIKFRKNGLSYGEISKKLDVAKSTLSYWLKNVPLDERHRKRFYTKQIKNLSLGASSQKERRKREIEAIIKNAEREIRLPLSEDVYRFMGAALYWAEGSKTNQFSFCNSDPSLVVFMVKWLDRMFKIPPCELRASLNMYSQQNEVDLRGFWSQLTGIPSENFSKSFIKPISKGYKKNNLYYGTIKVRAPKGSDMRHQTFGWIKAALKQTMPEIMFIEKQWSFLKEVSRPINL